MQYYAYKKKQIKQVQTIAIANGSVDLETCMMKLNDDSEQEVKVRRTPDNKRARPDGEARHDPFGSGKKSLNKRLQSFLSETNVEWLG